MSHVVKNMNEKGKIVSIAALKKGCDELRLDGMTGLLELIETEKGKGHYRTWETDHGKFQRDWSPPSGMAYEELGKNADYVIRVTPKGRAYLKSKGYDNPYEVGVVWEEAEQCHRLVYDFFSKAKGLELIIGETVVNYAKDHRSGDLKQSCPALIQAYNVARDGLLAAKQGDAQRMLRAADGSVLVGSPADFLLSEDGSLLTLPDGTKIPLGVGDAVGEIGVADRVGSNLGGVQ